MATVRLSALFAATALIGFLAGCKKDPVIPTPVLETQEFTGTLSPGGTNIHTFTVSFAYSGTDASVTLKSLTGPSGAVSTTIGLGFGTLGFDGSCTRSSAATVAAANIGQEYATSGGLFGAGNYCISVFDAGTLAAVGALNYAITVKHY